jgi:hypothetical protein
VAITDFPHDGPEIRFITYVLWFIIVLQVLPSFVPDEIIKFSGSLYIFKWVSVTEIVVHEFVIRIIDNFITMSDNTMCLWKYNLDCGALGLIEGLFVATEKEIEKSLGKTIYFGQILGEESDIFIEFFEAHLERVNVSQTTIAEMTQILGDTWCGYNPMDYIDYDSDTGESSSE